MKYYGITNSGNDFLEHHGILGQKWGKQNGPPYPLGSDDHSGKEVSLAKKTGTKIGKSSGLGHHGGAAQIQNGKHYKHSSNSDEAKKAKRKQTLKKVAIGAAVVVGAAAVGYAVYKHNASIKQAQELIVQQNAQKAADVAIAKRNWANETGELVSNLSDVKVSDITDNQYRHMFLENENGHRENNVYEAMEQAYRWNAFVDKYGTTNLKDIEFNKGLDDMVKQHVDEYADIDLLDKGQEGYKIAFGDAGKNFDPSKVKYGLYVTGNESDRRIYRGMLGNHNGDDSATKYEINFDVNKDVISPSGYKRAKIVRDMFKDESYRDSLGKELAKAYGSSDSDSFKRGLYDGVRASGAKLDNVAFAGQTKNPLRREFGSYGSNAPMYIANWSLVKGGSKPYQEYVDRVKKQGYNAIVDDHDRFDKLGEMPFVMLNAKDDISNISKRVVDDVESGKDQLFALGILQKRGWKG